MNENAKSAADGGTEFKARAQKSAHEAKRAGASAAETVAGQASEAAHAAADKAEELADRGKNAGADRIEGFAHAARKAADDLDRDSPYAAGYVREAADRIERMSSSVRSSSMGDIVESVEEFARSQPVAFFGGSVLAGFALARFVKSSSERARRQERYDSSAVTSREAAWTSMPKEGRP